MRIAAALLATLLAAAPADADELTVEKVVERYQAARGGAERWRALTAIELTGTYAAFSFYEPFRLIRARGDLYRLDYTVLGSPAVRARDARGPWGLDPLLWPQAAHVTEGPYKGQLEREAIFAPPLFDHAERGISVELAGEGDVEGTPTVDLRLSFPDGAEEIWHLDRESWLEVAVDATIVDFTQGPNPLRRRSFFDDFRAVGGLVLPHQVDHEFGARLEAMTVERVRLDPPLTAADFAAPAPPAPAPEPVAESESEAGSGGC